MAAAEAQRSSRADRKTSDAGNVAGAERAAFDGDWAASDSDDARGERGQLEPDLDRDQDTADRRHVEAENLTTAHEKAHESAATTEKRCRPSAS